MPTEVFGTVQSTVHKTSTLIQAIALIDQGFSTEALHTMYERGQPIAELAKFVLGAWDFARNHNAVDLDMDGYAFSALTETLSVYETVEDPDMVYLVFQEYPHGLDLLLQYSLRMLQAFELPKDQTFHVEISHYFALNSVHPTRMELRDSCGGEAWFITAENIKYISTSHWLEQQTMKDILNA